MRFSKKNEVRSTPSKARSIKNQITNATSSLVVIPLLVLGITASLLTYHTSLTATERDTTEIIALATERVHWELQSYKNITIDAGTSEHLASAESESELRSFIESKVSFYEFDSGNFINKDGIDLDGIDHSGQPYFTAALNNTACVSEPVHIGDSEEMTIVVSAPVYKDGDSSKEIIGCIYFVPHKDFLNDIAKTITASQNSDAYILNKEGTTIAAVDAQRVSSKENIQSLAETNPELKELAFVHSEMEDGLSGFERAATPDGAVYMVYAPIPGTDGWSLALRAPVMDFMIDTLNSVVITVILLTVCIIIAVFISNKIGKKIGDGINSCCRSLSALERGELNTNIPVINSKDEIQQLSESTRQMSQVFSSIISDISRILTAIASGQLNVNTTINESLYIGDFKAIIDELNKTKNDIKHTMSDIKEASVQVSAGATQISDGAQVLAQGATEQAGAVEELASTIATVSEKVHENYECCNNAKQQFDNAVIEMGIASDHMHNLKDAMDNINSSSQKIKDVIGVIDDIAFQTNILALNAAVEAARAGEAGRGFSVVADEVRNLATKSQEAVRETEALILESVRSVESGVAVTGEASSSMSLVEDAMKNMETVIARIKEDSEEQSVMMNQINEGIGQISIVIQNNTATAEESAAASEELDGQATMLNSLVERYR